MRPRITQLLLLSVAALTLLLAALVYVVDRPAGSAYLAPSWWAPHGPSRSLFGAVGDWLPSFAHAFAFTVFTGAVLPATRWRAWLAGGLWSAIGTSLEIGQHPALSQQLAAALPGWFASVPVLDHLGGYWRRGTFDVRDLIAVLAGCASAAVLVRRTSACASPITETNHVCRS
jgi:hypothetical protein